MHTTPTYPAAYSATMSHVVTVAAATGDPGTPLASFSNYDSSGSTVQLSAPGVAILSTVPGGSTQSWSGTRWVGRRAC